MFGASSKIEHRLKCLEEHLREENPLLVDAVTSFRRLDKIAYRLGLLERDQSYTMQIAWWPLVSILGTFSAGKSTFINHFLDYPLQETGNQAVDDKFKVICYAGKDEPRILPGIALDADPRFPFYQMSEELEKVSPGEGRRVDSYVQLKTCHSDKLRGMLLIDSPGFDADAQRTATLRITDYIVNLTDLVLVFFDARHPEPGAMQDTLTHLVANTINRSDSSKFVYVLNQIDTTAKEDNPEDVVAAWQRALAYKGLTAGKFYTIYNPDSAVPIEDEALRKRFERKRDEDLNEIHNRMSQVGVERIYRIVDSLEKTAREIEDMVPRIQDLTRQWAHGVLLRNAILFGLIVSAVVGIGVASGVDISNPLPMWMTATFGTSWTIAILILFTLGIGGVLHFWSRRNAAKYVLKNLKRAKLPTAEYESLRGAFNKNSRDIHSIYRSKPVGWGRRTKKKLDHVVAEADHFIQTLNNRFANPSGPAAPLLLESSTKGKKKGSDVSQQKSKNVHSENTSASMPSEPNYSEKVASEADADKDQKNILVNNDLGAQQPMVGKS